MIDVIKVHRLGEILDDPNDVRAEALRAIIRARRGVVVQDAHTGQRFTPTMVGRALKLEPVAKS
ncbi:MAG TPA: hypothetical protein VHE35_00395 [Kofleriaceae bacterium]|nr:hypothetical protein [Kofleriaceae bacterium]